MGYIGFGTLNSVLAEQADEPETFQTIQASYNSFLDMESYVLFSEIEGKENGFAIEIIQDGQVVGSTPGQVGSALWELEPNAAAANLIAPGTPLVEPPYSNEVNPNTYGLVRVTFDKPITGRAQLMRVKPIYRGGSLQGFDYVVHYPFRVSE